MRACLILFGLLAASMALRASVAGQETDPASLGSLLQACEVGIASGSLKRNPGCKTSTNFPKRVFTPTESAGTVTNPVKMMAMTITAIAPRRIHGSIVDVFRAQSGKSKTFMRQCYSALPAGVRTFDTPAATDAMKSR